MSMRVVVGLSGGVDSAVSAALLQKEGYEVIGIFMRNWHDNSVVINQECPWIDDSNDAMLVAEHLGIPFQVLDLSEAYRSRIVEYMFREYEVGRTPNPDVLCNREIKFDIFLDAAIQLNADFIATGHYVRKEAITPAKGDHWRLLAGVDAGKDQSYFLCQLNQRQLSKALFPIGHLQKSEVRAIAQELQLPNATKKDSQGLCFIGKVRLPEFLQQQLAPKEGVVLEVDPHEFHAPMPLSEPDWNHLGDYTRAYNFKGCGHEIGKHNGAHYYTVGQRKGLKIGGKAQPLFVLATDTVTNVIYVGAGENHPGLLRKGLQVATQDIHWVRDDYSMKPGESRSFKARIRYRQELSDAQLWMTENTLYVTFNAAQRGIACGQFVAWYIDDELIGSGVISGL
jgi:tRNA-specific 2-thiouridylase